MTAVVRARADDALTDLFGESGELLGLLLHDARDPKQVASYLAERAQIIKQRGGEFLRMQNGHIVRRPDGGSDTGKEAGKDGKPAVMSQIKAGKELYDLESDESETTDVAARNPEVVRRLDALADRMRADLGDTLPKKK